MMKTWATPALCPLPPLPFPPLITFWGVLLRDSLTHLCMSERVKGGSGGEGKYIYK